MKKDKAYFLPRVMAYLIDAIIISLVVNILAVPFYNDNVDTLNKEYEMVGEKYVNKEITTEEYLYQSMDLSYDMNYNMIPVTIIDMTCLILYFVVYQHYKKGQTLGKKIMKVKIVSNNNEELLVNNYVYRSLLLNGVLIGILDIISMLFISKNYGIYISFTLQFIQIVLILITVLMVLFSKQGRGLHDKLGNTKVVMCD